jgi:hypothetical protein
MYRNLNSIYNISIFITLNSWFICVYLWILTSSRIIRRDPDTRHFTTGVLQVPGAKLFCGYITTLLKGIFASRIRICNNPKFRGKNIWQSCLDVLKSLLLKLFSDHFFNSLNSLLRFICLKNLQTVAQIFRSCIVIPRGYISSLLRFASCSRPSTAPDADSQFAASFIILDPHLSFIQYEWTSMTTDGMKLKVFLISPSQ